MNLEIPDTLSDSISKELLNPSLDLSIDYAELALDNIIENELLKETPIIKTIAALSKTGYLIREKWFLKKLLTFIKQLNSGDIDPIKLEKFKEKFDNNNTYQDKVVDQIIIMNDAFKDITKAKIFANLFKAYIEAQFDWERLHSLLIILDQLHPEGYKVLEKLSEKKFLLRHGELSLSNNGHELVHLMSAGIGYTTTGHGSVFRVTKMGIELFQFGISELYKQNNTTMNEQQGTN